MNIVVIGGGAAGSSAAVRAKRYNPSSNVILIEKTDMVTHGPCAIPYYIEGLIDSRSKLVTYTPEYLREKRGIDVRINSRVIDIDIDKRVVVVENASNQVYRIRWDRLVIATGAQPLVLPGSEKANVITIRHPANADRAREVITRANAIAIVGGGYLGIEMAEAASALGKKVMIFEKASTLMPEALDDDMAKLVEDEVRARGIDLHLSEPVVELTGKEVVEKVVTEKAEYRVDAVILAIGVRPNVELAKSAGLKLGAGGAIAVNEYMETSAEDVYAAGDVVEKYHKVLKCKVWIPLATSANKEGQVAGANAARGKVLRFGGIVGTSVTKFYDFYIAKTGLTEKEALRYGIKCRSTMVRVKTKAHYYPGATEVVIKMVVNSDDVIIGVQALGKDIAVAHYIDAAALAIENEMSIYDLFLTDLGYMPATAPVWHPLIVAARVLSEGRF